MLSAALVEQKDVESAHETQFPIIVDNGRTLGLSGDKEVKYSDVVSGDESFTMLLRLCSGRDSLIPPPSLIFKNKDGTYLMRGTPEVVLDFANHAGPKGWMKKTVLPQWLSKGKCLRKLLNDRRGVLYMKNCSDHYFVERINIDLKYFPPNDTHFI